MKGRWIWALVLLTLTGCPGKDDDEIPMPPPGYEYCVVGDNEGLGFCPKK